MAGESLLILRPPQGVTAPSRLLPARQSSKRQYGLLQLAGSVSSHRPDCRLGGEFPFALAGGCSLPLSHFAFRTSTASVQFYQELLDKQIAMPTTAPTAPIVPNVPHIPTAQYAVGIDIGSTVCTFTVLRADRTTLLKAQEFEHNVMGFALLLKKLEQLELAKVAKEQLIIGMEATSCYWENLYQWLLDAGYQVYLPAFLHSAPSTNCGLCTSAGFACQNRPAGCSHDSASVVERGSAIGLRR